MFCYVSFFVTFSLSTNVAHLIHSTGAHLERVSVILLHQEHRGPTDVRRASIPRQVTTILVPTVAVAVAVNVAVARANACAAAVATPPRKNLHVDVFSLLQDVVEWEEHHVLDNINMLYTHIGDIRSDQNRSDQKPA